MEFKGPTLPYIAPAVPDGALFLADNEYAGSSITYSDGDAVKGYKRVVLSGTNDRAISGLALNTGKRYFEVVVNDFTAVGGYVYLFGLADPDYLNTIDDTNYDYHLMRFSGGNIYSNGGGTGGGAGVSGIADGDVMGFLMDFDTGDFSTMRNGVAGQLYATDPADWGPLVPAASLISSTGLSLDLTFNLLAKDLIHPQPDYLPWVELI